MASSTTKHHVKRTARSVAAEGERVRERVRELSVHAFTNGQMRLRDLPKLVGEVLEGAADGVDKSIPKAASNVLREVFDGLSDGVHAIATASSSAAKDAKAGAQRVVKNDVPQMVDRVREANGHFLDAVQKFAKKASKETREQMDSLAQRAKRTAPRVEESMKRAAKATDGRVMELTGETAKAGVRAVRRAAGILAMGAGGVLEGLADAVMPREKAGAKGKAGNASAKKASPTKASAKKAAVRRNVTKAKSSAKAATKNAKSAAKSAGKAVKAAVKPASKPAKKTRKAGKK